MTNIWSCVCARAIIINGRFILMLRLYRRRHGISHSGFERMNTKAKPGWACRFRRCEKLLQSTNGNLATARRAGLDPATAFTCAASTPDRDSTRFTDSFPAASRRSTRVSGISTGRERFSDLSLRRRDQNFTAPFWRLEKDFRGDASGAEIKCFERTRGLPLVQLALRPKDDRDRATPCCFWQTAFARQTDLYGPSGIRGD